MKGCLTLLLVVAAMAVGGYAVYTNPHLPSQATQAAQQAATWAHTVVDKATAATPSEPQATASSKMAGATSAPVVLTIPTSAAYADVAHAEWSTSDCRWVAYILRLDARLDGAEAANVANGSDTRYGTGPALVAYYQGYEAEWVKLQGEAAASCASPSVDIPDADRADAVSWFQRAVSAHQADTAVRPADYGWNETWIAHYTRLTALFNS